MHDDDTATITGGPLRPHEYVLVKTELTAKDERIIHNSLAKGKLDDMGGSNTQFMLGDVQMATMKRAILGWQLSKYTKHPDGHETSTPIPFSVDAIENLPARIYRHIVTEYAKITAEPGDSESDKDFTNAASDGHAGS